MKNTVELIGFYGSDITHAQSAWTSTSRDLNEDKLKRMPALLEMLAKNNHHTPFEKSTLHFLVTCDQASHVHLLKHRVGVSINGESARYKELKDDKFYLPDDFKDTSVNVKKLQENGVVWNFNCWQKSLEDYTKLGNDLYHQCLEDLTPVLGRKRAKESARFFKTFNSQITMDISFNFRSFVHFLNLRNKPDSQKEIQEIAQQMLDLVKYIPGNPFEHTLKAFNL